MEGRTTKMGYRKVWWLRCLSTLLWELWLVDLHPPIRNRHVRIWWTSHNRLGEIRIDSDSIWTPGIIFYNARNGQFSPEFKVKLRFIFKLIFKSSDFISSWMIGNLKIILSVYSDGSVSWMPPALFRATCNIKVKLFPFDKQQCRLIFRSTDYDATLMDFRTRLLRVKLLVISLETYIRSALKEKHVLLNNLISKFQMFHQNGLFWILRNNF